MFLALDDRRRRFCKHYIFDLIYSAFDRLLLLLLLLLGMD